MADTAELYDALRAADAAGDVDGAKRLAEYIQSLGPTTVAPGKTGADLIPGQSVRAPAPDDVHSSEEYAPPTVSKGASMVPKTDLMKKAAKEDRVPIIPLAEAGLNVATGIGASAAGGLRGLYNLATGEGPEAAARAVEDTQQKYTYQPKTAAGQVITQASGVPFQMAGKVAGAVGGQIGQAMGNEAAGETIGEAAVPIAAILMGGAGALKARSALTAAERTAQAAQESAQRAEAATRSAGIDWGKLSLQARKNIMALATDATDISKLSPEMIKRAAEMQQLPVPIQATKGQLARDPVQLRTEQQLSGTPEGVAIQQRYVEQNQALLDNLDVLAGRPSPRAKSAEGVGYQVADKALKAKADEAKANVNRLYQKANRSAESSETVSPYPLIDYVRDHPNSGAVSWITNKLKSQQVLTGTDDLGQLMPSRDISLRELAELRKTAERVSASGGEGAGWAREAKGVIDKMMEGKGGSEYQAARDAYKAYKSEFDNQGAVKQLVETKGGYSTDRKVALEDVFKKTVIDGSIQDLRNVRESLLTGSKGTQKQGRKALRELAGETINYIKNEATKSTVNDQTGVANLSVPAMKKAIARIGDEKLDLLLGESTAGQLRAILKAGEDLKTSPPKYIQGSDTAINAMTLLDKVGKGIGGMVEHVPYAGTVVKGAAKAVGRAYELGKSEEEVQKALMNKKKIPETPYRMKEATDELGNFLPGAAAAIQSERP